MSHRRWLIAVSLVAHVGLVLTLFIAGFWNLSRLEAPKHVVSLAVAPPPPPAPAGGPELPAAHFTPKTPHTVVHEVVQPPHVRQDQPSIAATGGGGGAGSGAGSGTGTDPDGVGTCVDGPCGVDTQAVVKPPPPDPPPPPPRRVPPLTMKGMLLSDPAIHPNDLVKSTMLREGHNRVIAAFEVCVGDLGNVTKVVMHRSTGYESYDTALLAGIRSWRYRPYLFDGRPTAVCGMVTFIYTIGN